MTFRIIRYKHKFLRNIYTKEQINYSSDITDSQSYYKTLKTEIKNALSTSYKKALTFNLKIYAFVYNELVYFRKSDIQYETFPTKKFFIHVHRLIKMKIHLHHSHITGKTIGYSHDFCKTTVVEKTSPDIPVIAHNLFGFDLYYFIKGYIVSAWCSKSLNIAGNNLTHKL